MDLPTFIQPGVFVIHAGEPAVVHQMLPGGAVLHYLDRQGETVLRDAAEQEAFCPQTGNPRTHVAHQRLVPLAQLRIADWNELPPSRRPKDEEPPSEGTNGRRKR